MLGRQPHLNQPITNESRMDIKKDQKPQFQGVVAASLWRLVQNSYKTQSETDQLKQYDFLSRILSRFSKDFNYVSRISAPLGMDQDLILMKLVKSCKPKDGIQIENLWNKIKSGLEHGTNLIYLMYLMKDQGSRTSGSVGLDLNSFNSKSTLRIISDASISSTSPKPKPEPLLKLASVFNSYYAPLVSPSEFTFVSESKHNS